MDPKTYYYQLLPKELREGLLLFCPKGLTWILSLLPEFNSLIGKRMALVWKTFVCRYAVKYNNKGLLEWAINQGCPLNSECLIVAANEGNQEMCRYLYQKSCPVSDKVTEVTLINNNVELLLWLEGIGHLENEIFVNEKLPKVPSIVVAGSEGSLEALKFLLGRRKNNSYAPLVRCVERAGINGHVNILEWLLDAYPLAMRLSKWRKRVATSAAFSCNLDLFKWLETKTDISSWPRNLCDAVLMCGKVKEECSKHFKETFLWLRSKGFVYTQEGIENACLHYNIAGLEIINEQNLCAWPNKNPLIKKLVKRGTNNCLDVIIWLKKNKPEMLEGYDLCVLSTEYSSLRIFEWARRNGYSGMREDGEKINAAVEKRAKFGAKLITQHKIGAKIKMIEKAKRELNLAK